MNCIVPQRWITACIAHVFETRKPITLPVGIKLKGSCAGLHFTHRTKVCALFPARGKTISDIRREAKRLDIDFNPTSDSENHKGILVLIQDATELCLALWPELLNERRDRVYSDDDH